MKRNLLLAVMAVLGSMAVSCRQHHIKTVHITVPDMRNEACVEVISNALRRVQGLLFKDIAYDLPQRTVTVSYDSLNLARKNIEFAIVDAGFSTEELAVTPIGEVQRRIPANPEAVKKLPPACLVQQ